MPETVAVRVQKDGQQTEQELASRTLRIQNKRFYVDVKQNRRGRFVKLTEAGNGGQKSRIVMSISVALELQEKISKLIDVYAGLPPHNPQSLAEDGRLLSDKIMRDGRLYYLDLKENERGRFLRLAMLSMGVRDYVAIPAQGMAELRDTLSELTQEYAEDAHNESRVLFVGNKTFYFDVGFNRFGVYLRISEVRAHVRSSVTIPEPHCLRFRDIIDELASVMTSKNAKNGPSMNGDHEDQSTETLNETAKPESEVSNPGDVMPPA